MHTIGWNFPAREPPTHMGTRPPPRPTHPPIGEGRTPSSPGSSMNDCTSGHGRGYLEELVADPIIRHGQFSQKDGKIANRGAPVVAIRRVSVFPGHWRILTHTPLGEQGWELHLAGEGRDKLALRRETIRWVSTNLSGTSVSSMNYQPGCSRQALFWPRTGIHSG